MYKKQLWGLPIVILLFGMTTGCTGNNRTVDYQQNDLARPLGYYSNENHQNKISGLFSDNDGPVTELLDHTLGAESELANKQRKMMLQTRDHNGNPPNPTVPLSAEDQFFIKDNRFSTGDVNYHNQLNQNINHTGFSTDQHTLLKISDQIRRKVTGVRNVRNVRSVAYGSSILISVDLRDKRMAASTKKAIQEAVKPYAKGKAVTIITDEGTFSRYRSNQTGVRDERVK